MNLNHLTISGNLTRPVESRTVGADKLVAKFTIANNNKFKVNGELREEATFLDCECWDKQAETASQYLSQGSLVVVEGKLKQENWEDKTTGAKRSKLVLRVERLHLTPKRDGQASPQQDNPAPRRAATASSSTSSVEDPPF